MGLLSPVLILLMFAAALLAILTILEAGRRRSPDPKPVANRAVWEEVAKRLGGAIDDQGDESRIRFKWNDRDASLSDTWPTVFRISAGSFGSMNVEFVAPDAVDPRDFTIKKLEDFRVMGVRGNAERAGVFLSPPVRRILRDLVAIGGGRTNVLIDEVLRVEGKPAREVKHLVRFAVLCLQLAQHAKLFVEPASEVRVIETRSVAAGVCQVCGADLGGRLVRCSRCSTPHHADCWEYAGVCSTYGCGGTSAVD